MVSLHLARGGEQPSREMLGSATTRSESDVTVPANGRKAACRIGR